jgi:hypothetical protein
MAAFSFAAKCTLFTLDAGAILLGAGSFGRRQGFRSARRAQILSKINSPSEAWKGNKDGRRMVEF